MEFLDTAIRGFPMVAVFAALSYLALKAAFPKRNDEWEVQNKYIDYNLRKKYPISRNPVHVDIQEKGTERFEKK